MVYHNIGTPKFEIMINEVCEQIPCIPVHMYVCDDYIFDDNDIRKINSYQIIFDYNHFLILCKYMSCFTLMN